MIEEKTEQINHKYDLRKVFIVNEIYRFLNKEDALKFEEVLRE
jgi:hypothetical protein